METTVIGIIVGFLGLCFGSFINALVWRLHEKRNFVSERSECVHCHHELAWYDLLPIVSWLQLGGKCRYCKKAISAQYPLVELVTAVAFVVSYLVWPFGVEVLTGVVLLVIWLVMLVLLIALAVYDARWYLLPHVMTVPLIVLGAAFGLLHTLGYQDMSVLDAVIDLILGITSVGGLYYGLYKLSKGAWVGFGDVMLGIAMGLVLGWQLGLLSVFVANIVGLLVILPGLVSKKLSSKSRIPFGPFLIVGLVISLLWGGEIIDWYIGAILSL